MIEEPDEPQIRHELYGDEQKRFADVQSLSYADFKQLLLNLRRIVGEPSEEPIEDFFQGDNLMGAGWMAMAGADVHFPRLEDKEELLQYALQKAQDSGDVQAAALILATAVVAVHPFADGNGRVSRGLYGQLSKGLDPGSEEFKRLTKPHPKDEQDNTAREQVDMGEGILGGWAHWYVYKLNQLDPDSAPFALFVGTDGKAVFPPKDQIPGASEEDYNYLLNAAGIENGHLRSTDVNGLRFALSKAINSHPEFRNYVLENSNGTTSVVMAEFLTKEPPEIFHEIAEAVAEYRKLRAQAAIDFACEDIGGKIIFNREGVPISLRNMVIEASNNFLASKVTKTS